MKPWTLVPLLAVGATFGLGCRSGTTRVAPVERTDAGAGGTLAIPEETGETAGDAPALPEGHGEPAGNAAATPEEPSAGAEAPLAAPPVASQTAEPSAPAADPAADPAATPAAPAATREEPPPQDAAPSPEALAMVGAPLLDLRHQLLGRIDDVLIDASTAKVTHAVLQTDEQARVGILLPRAQWIWDPEARTFLLRWTRAELAALEHDEMPLEGVKVIAERDPVPLEENPFDSGPLEDISGLIRGIEEGEGSSLSFELRDDANHFRRVYLAPRTALPSELHLGQQVALQAVATRDERGALWVAASIRLKEGEEFVQLRDASGRVPWPGAEGRRSGSLLVSARAFVRYGLTTSDGQALRAMDVLVDVACERAQCLLLAPAVSKGGARFVPWNALVFEEGKDLRTSRSAEELDREAPANLPVEWVGLFGLGVPQSHPPSGGG